MTFGYSADPVPALILPVEVSPLESSASRSVAGKLDTGSDMSVIPDSLADVLGLGVGGDVWVRGAYSEWERRPTFWVRIALTDGPFFEVEVLSSPRRDCLVGRDILNRMVLHADGPAKTFELGTQS